MSLVSVLLVSFKWFKGEPTKPATQDAVFVGLLQRVTEIEAEFDELVRAGKASREAVAELQGSLAGVKREAMAALPKAEFDNPQLLQSLLLAIMDARERIGVVAVDSLPTLRS